MEFDPTVVAALKEGNTFELGVLFPGLDAKEKITWQVLEKVVFDLGSFTEYVRVTCRLHWRDVFIGNAVIVKNAEGCRLKEKLGG